MVGKMMVRILVLILVLGVLQTPSAFSEDRPRQVVVTPGQEMAWRQKMMEEFLSLRALTEDEALALRAATIGKQVAALSDRPDMVFRFLVVEGDELQAYSFPGGAVCLTEALVRFFESDDQLAFAIGHEISHVVLRHAVSRMSFEQALTAAPKIPEGRFKPVKSFYARNAELEADTFGALYATRAGYAFSASYQSLEELERVMPFQADDAHPAFGHRIKALKEFRSELERAVGLFDTGTEALQAGETGDAIEALRLFVATFPNSLSGRVNLGAAYLARVRAKSGTPANLAEVLPILPDPGVTLRGVVDIVDLQSAEENFRHALNFHDDNTWAAAGLALVYARQERYDESRRLLTDILAREPDNYNVRICLGNIDFLEGKHPSAMAAYRKVLEQRPAWPEATKNLAMVSEEVGETGEARLLWEKLTNHDVFGSEARLHLLALEEPDP